jgi:titin
MRNYPNLTHMLTNYFVCTAPDSVEVAPTVDRLADVTVMEGGPAQFRTQITGVPSPTVQWLREGSLIPQSSDFQVNLVFF